MSALIILLSFAADLTAQHSPMTIRLELTPKGQLRAFLRNESPARLWVVHDSNLQPSRLEISGPAGPIHPFDRRSLKKFDNTVRREDYVSLQPGKELPLFDEKVGRELVWGPYLYRLTPGEYRVENVFQSEKNTFYDDENHATKKLKDAWLGTARSNSVTLHIR